MLEYLTILFEGLNARRDSERGASAVEYGLLVAGIAALIVAVVFVIGGLIDTSFTDTCDEIATKGGTQTASVTC